MDQRLSIRPLLEKLDQLCPTGYAIALHIHYTTPAFLFQTYNKDWIDYYSEHGLVLQDPTVMWGFTHTGIALWEDMEADDASGVIKKAAEYGIRHGFTAALNPEGSRSVASFTRADRQFSEAERDVIYAHLKALHEMTVDTDALPESERAALRRLSVNLTHQ